MNKTTVNAEGKEIPLYAGLPVIVGLSNKGLSATSLVLPTVLNESDYAAVLSDDAIRALNSYPSVPAILVDTRQASNNYTNFTPVPDANRFSAGRVTNLTIPEGYIAIGKGSFAGVKSLSTVYYNAAVNIAVTSDAFVDSAIVNIYTPAEQMEDLTILIDKINFEEHLIF